LAQEFDKTYAERVLAVLDERSLLFPQFTLKKINNELKLLGIGGFSSVYEMINIERTELSFALKVIGFQRHTISSEEFRNTGRIQWILCQESPYIMRILDMRELVLFLDDKGEIAEVKDATKEAWEETEHSLYLQFVLMEKLEELIEKDRFANVKLLREVLGSEAEVLKFALEIGQAIGSAHTNNCLHRDIKLENIFWDALRQVYKLGDFGIAKWTEDGTAETIVYTDGYGAPEIERRLYDSYNVTADIYSFGITLYLLLNDLKFPGSDGYYSKTEVQYNPEFIFPAPAHASEALTRVIRKMCSFYSKDRYSSINEVLAELSNVIDSMESDVSEELFELADMATETFKREKTEKKEKEVPEGRGKTRAERKEEQRIIDILYREDSVKYFAVFTVLLTLLCKGLETDASKVTDWMFFVLPAAVLLEALFQKIKEFHIFFGALVLVFSLFSVYSAGLTSPHIILMLCVLIGCPLFTLAGGLSVGLWMVIEIFDSLSVLDYLYKWDLGWVILIVVMLVGYGYLHMKMEWGKIAETRVLLGTYIYDKVSVVMVFLGLILFGLEKGNVIEVPELLDRMHLVRTGIISFICMCVFERWYGAPDKDTAMEEGEN